MARAKDLERRRFWEAQLRAWERSGLTQVDFCRREGLGRRSFGFWKRRLGFAAQEQPSPPAAPVQFVSLAIRPERTAQTSEREGPSRASLALVTSGGHRIEIGDEFTPGTLARLLATLEGL